MELTILYAKEKTLKSTASTIRYLLLRQQNSATYRSALTAIYEISLTCLWNPCGACEISWANELLYEYISIPLTLC